MEKTLWIGRERGAMARHSALRKARLIRYAPAARHSLEAAHRLPAPMVPKAPTERARLTLHLPERRDPAPPGGDGR